MKLTNFFQEKTISSWCYHIKVAEILDGRENGAVSSLSVQALQLSASARTSGSGVQLPDARGRTRGRQWAASETDGQLS